MSTRKVFSIIGLILSVLLIICLFLPFIGGYGESYSLWKYFDLLGTSSTGVIVIIELLICVLAFILQLTGATKDAKLAYFGLGYYFTYHIALFISALDHSALDQLEFGFWIGMILSIATLIIIIIGSFVSNDSKPKYNGYMQPTGFDPKTGKPIFDAPKQIVGYDPQTGQPIYK